MANKKPKTENKPEPKVENPVEVTLVMDNPHCRRAITALCMSLEVENPLLVNAIDGGEGLRVNAKKIANLSNGSIRVK